MFRRDVTEDWVKMWEDSMEELFRLALEECLERPQRCGELLDKVRESRESVRQAPDPVWSSLAQGVLDELWEAARLSVYGDLLPAQARIGAAQDKAGELRTLLSHQAI